MSASALALIAVLLTQVGPPRVAIIAGPLRAFGGQTITRTLQVDGEGQYDMVWQTRIFRGIVEKGRQEVTAPGKVTVELRLPEVRARVDLVQEWQLKRDDKVVVAGEYPIAVFPDNILKECAAAADALPPLGLYDPEDLIGPVFEKAGMKYINLQANLQVQTLESKLVLVAPNQAETLAEPMSGIRELLERGGTVIFLEQDSPRKGFFDPEKPVEVVKTGTSLAQKLVGGRHILLRDMLEGDLADWAGSGHVASHALAWPEWPGYQAWLKTEDAAGNLPLVAQYWGANGRVILCQLEVGRRLAQEPAAQLVLRNLLSYAREVALPRETREVRMAVPPEALEGGKFNTARFILGPKKEDLKRAAGLLVLVLPKGDETAIAPGFDLAKYLGDGGKLFIQSPFGQDFLEALNHLTRSVWQDKPNLPLPRFVATPVEEKIGVQVKYAKPLAWGISAENFQQSLEGVEDRRSLKVETDTPGFLALIEPGLLAEFRRGKSKLVLCALPVEDPENESRARVVRQIVANMTLGGDNDAQ